MGRNGLPERDLNKYGVNVDWSHRSLGRRVESNLFVEER